MTSIQNLKQNRFGYWKLVFGICNLRQVTNISSIQNYHSLLVELRSVGLEWNLSLNGRNV
jgi:hypothetical protein